MVTADGRLVRADYEHEPELFWAVRGPGPWAARQMYLNFAETQTPAAPSWTEHAEQRLRRIKAAFDPHNLIRANHPVPPAAR
jgi:Berberine and berberine like